MARSRFAPTTGRWSPKFPTFTDKANPHDIHQFLADDAERDDVDSRMIQRKNIQTGRYAPEPTYAPGTDPDRRSDLVVWDQAPPTSHLIEFRLIDARNFSEQEQFELNNSSYIEVKFKPSGKRGITHYQYRFTDHDYANRVFDMLLNADHPGIVVQDVLIGERVPYVKIAED